MNRFVLIVVPSCNMLSECVYLVVTFVKFSVFMYFCIYNCNRDVVDMKWDEFSDEH